MKNCFQVVNGDDNLNKQDLIDKGYKHVCTQNSESKIELWAKFNGYKDTIVYLYYIPKVTDKDDYPDDNHCHWYELTQEKDKTVILNVWNDEPDHMIIDDRFEKIIK